MQKSAVTYLKGPLNTHTTYGSVERGLHWAVAALLITGAVLGKVAYEWPYDTGEALATKATLFSAHKTVGVCVFFLALFRIGWALSQPRPRPLYPNRVWETRLASLIHWLLYGSLVLVPLSGWIHHAASSGFAPIWWPFGQSLPFVPKDPVLSARLGELHELCVKVLIVSLVLHIVGTLKHVFIDRDITLARKWSGRDPGELPEETNNVLSILMAGLIWTGTLVIGWAATIPETSEASQAATVEEPENGNWTVMDGTLSIDVLQMGQTVHGQFDTWTARIDFDETIASGKAGTVVANIHTDSLNLGSVSTDAKGPDFIDALGHPIATYEADIMSSDTGYLADGTLSLRGATIPVQFPFTLDIAESVATMSGSVTLDRRDFGIGQSYQDEADVGFMVTVNVSLTARKLE